MVQSIYTVLYCFNKDELENIDFGAYLASSSDEESLLPAKHNSKAYRVMITIHRLTGINCFIYSSFVTTTLTVITRYKELE